MSLKTCLSVVLAAAVAACATAEEPEHAVVQDSPNALTLADCAEQRDACLDRNQPLGLLICPLQYEQCVWTASNGIPAAVAAAIGDTAACAQKALRCRTSSESPVEALECTQAEASCIADVIGANLPPIVTGTAECVEKAVSCVDDAESASDLATCRRTLEACTRDEVVSGLPPEVRDAAKAINACVEKLASCTREAGSPGELTACAQDQAECVAKGLGVTPPPRAQAAIDCAEAAVTCTLDATTPSGVRDCAATLVSCNARIGNPEQPLTCEQKWTECLVRDPFNFVQCRSKLIACRNPVAD